MDKPCIKSIKANKKEVEKREIERKKSDRRKIMEKRTHGGTKRFLTSFGSI